MNNRNFIFLFLLMFFCVTALHAGGGKEKAKIVQVTGIVRLVGTELFNDLVISGEYEWYIDKNEIEKLHHLQQRRVTVKGEETEQELKFANGMSAGIRRELRNITIISVE